MDFMYVLFYPTALMGALGLVFGVLLAMASVAFFVKPDIRVQLIREALPGANIGLRQEARGRASSAKGAARLPAHPHRGAAGPGKRAGRIPLAPVAAWRGLHSLINQLKMLF